MARRRSRAEVHGPVGRVPPAVIARIEAPARGRVELDVTGQWRSQDPEFAAELQRLFGHDYVPQHAYHPAGHLAAVAEDAAVVLGGRLSLPGYRDTTPPDAVN